MYSNILKNWNHTKVTDKTSLIILNFGPQHPAAHGVLRMILQLRHEYIVKSDIHIGLLHRGTEFLIQTKTLEKSLPYFDRLDYVSMLCQEHAYCLTIENILKNNTINYWSNILRILFDELTRILNHLLAVSCHALDIGSMSPLFWAFEERETIMEFYEYISGARMHAAFYTPNENCIEMHKDLFTNISIFLKKCYTTLAEINSVLMHNKIWKQRLVNVGICNINTIKQYHITGILARSVGLKYDVRLTKPYESYNTLTFNSYITSNGDCMDRFTLRMLEMGESLHIINQCLRILNTLNKPIKNAYKKKTMEDIIEEFKKWQLGTQLKSNTVSTSSIESPKGEFGITLYTTTHTPKPIRCKIKSSSFLHLQLLSTLCKNNSIADLTTLIGTIDIVFGEIDK